MSPGFRSHRKRIPLKGTLFRELMQEKESAQSFPHIPHRLEADTLVDLVPLGSQVT